jgi:MFS family permease
MAMSLASAIGPFLAGILVELWDWPAVYWVRVPIALTALALSGLLPTSSPVARPFDMPGAAMLASAMSLLLLALVLSQRPDVSTAVAAAVLATAIVFGAGYIRRAARAPEPIIRPSLFADPTFAVPNLLYVLANLAGFAILLLTPYYLANVLRLTSIATGSMLALAFAGSLSGAPLSALLVRAIGQRPTVFAGVALVGLALLPLACTGPATPLPVVGLLLVFEGIGQGLVGIAYTDMVTATLPPRDRGVAGSLAQLTRTLGIVSGASVLTALQAWGAAGIPGPEAFMAGYRFAFLTAGGGLLCALVLSCASPRVWFSRSRA